MEQIFKYVLKNGYRCRFLNLDPKPVETLSDVIRDFLDEEVSLVLIAAEERGYKIKNVIQWANEVANEYKQKRESERVKEAQ